MRKIFSSITALFLSLFRGPVIPHGETVDMDKFKLTWSDEFEGDSLDKTKWVGHNFFDENSVIRRGGWWNYDFATVKNGKLHIRTEYMKDGYKGGEPGWYTSALDTKGRLEQQGGYYEIRCILPKGLGLWSAFWLNCESMVKGEHMGGRDGAEIDVFESPYYHRKTKLLKNCISNCIHIDGYGKNHKSSGGTTAAIIGNNPYECFNTYALEWNSEGYTFYINGVAFDKTDFGGASLVPEYVILSVEIDGDNGVPSKSWSGDINANKPNEITDFVVDYVRVYQYK